MQSIISFSQNCLSLPSPHEKLMALHPKFTPLPADLEDPVVLRDLSEPYAGKVLYGT
jgi:hypothetical protein